MSAERPLSAIVLAAGKSTRMNSRLPKVLHPLLGRPLLSYVLDACFEVGIDVVHVVIGHHKDQVQEAFAQERRVRWVEQHQQLGTGHAVGVCRPCFEGFAGDVLIIAGDMPLVQPQTLRDLVCVQRASGADGALATAELDDPTGYGRILRNGHGRLQGILEHRDCNDDQRRIREVNISYYCFDAAALFAALEHLQPNEAKGEYYITEVVRMMIADGGEVATLPGIAPEFALGINSPEDLQKVEHVMRRRAAHASSR